MEENFYRSISKRRGVKDRLLNIARNPRRVFTMVFGIAVILYVLLDNKGIVKRIALEVQRREMTEKVEAAKQETKKLQAQIRALEGDKKTIEKIARERYGMARQGETVYRVKRD